MNSLAVRTLRVPSLVLAAALQVLPITRAALPVAQSTANMLAIIFRWAAGTAAALGGVQAVSGASTVITSPLSTNLTQGKPFSMRLTTAPNQAHYWTASGLPGGLSLVGTNGQVNWSISGTPTVTGTYNVPLTAKDQASSGVDRTTTATLVINISAGASPPTISKSPTSLTVTQGQNASFSVTASGTAPLSYQWRFQGAQLSGQTLSNLVLNAVTSANQGNYDVIVTNSGGSVTSSVAALTVIVPVVAPSIGTPPASLTVTQGQSATFSVTANGSAPLFYQWRFNGANLGGQNAASLAINPATTNNAGNYDVIVTNSAGSVTSSVANLNVIVPVTPPNIGTPPASLTVTQGQSAAFSVAASGSNPLFYQWRFKGTNLGGQNSASLLVNPATTNNAGNYDVIVTNSAGSVTSSVATLTVVVPVFAPTVGTPPSSLTVTQGQSATFSVTANGTVPFFYQWRFNGSNLGGQINPSLTINSTTTNNAGGYDVIITNSVGSVTSSVATLTVIVPGSPLQITSQPISQTVTQGQTASFSVAASGTGTLNFQWRFKGTNLNSQINSNLVINSATTNNAGNYDVIVSNGSGTVTSAVATLTVLVPVTPVQITSQPSSLTVTQGQSATFIVGASGSGPLNYQWRFKGTNLLSQINSNLAINSATAANAGNYDVIVSNSGGSVTSTVVTLTVIVPTFAPVITNQPLSLTVTQGNNALFLVGASGTTPMSFAWLKNGTVISDNVHFIGSQSNLLSITSAVTNDTGNYSVIVSNVAGVVTSQVAVLTVVLPRPVIAPITLQISGAGTISPLTNGQSLQIGASYTITATPATGFSFVNWSGGISATTTSLTFVMQSNLVLRANFVSDAVAFVNGNYNGLFFDPAGTTFVSSGPITITTTIKGKYSGSLTLAGVRSSFSGQFDLAGHATNAVARGRLSSLALELQLDKNNPNVITGQVTDGNWISPFIADRAVFDAKTNVAPQAGSYTLVIPGVENDSMRPAGNGFGTVTVGANGRVQFRGTLANGTKASQTTTLSENGDWALYVTLPGSRGSVLGWLSFTNRDTDDINGTVIWLLLQQPSAKFYPTGFSLQSEAVGSRYVAPPSGTASLLLANAQLILTGGNLGQPLRNNFTLSGNNKAANLSPNPLTLSITTANGLFTGKVTDPATGKPISFNGAVLQKQNAGYGFFVGTNQSGSVSIAP